MKGEQISSSKSGLLFVTTEHQRKSLHSKPGSVHEEMSKHLQDILSNARLMFCFKDKGAMFL